MQEQTLYDQLSALEEKAMLIINNRKDRDMVFYPDPSIITPDTFEEEPTIEMQEQYGGWEQHIILSIDKDNHITALPSTALEEEYSIEPISNHTTTIHAFNLSTRNLAVLADLIVKHESEPKTS